MFSPSSASASSPSANPFYKTHLTTKSERGIDGLNNEIGEFPAPWKLNISKSFVFLFNGNEEIHDKVLEPLRIVECDRADSFKKGIGALMIIRYENSPAGPYDELILIDGPYQSRGRQHDYSNLPTVPQSNEGMNNDNPNGGIKLQNRKAPFLPDRRIPHIWVSTEASLRNGRKNWGIRKELADFEWSTPDPSNPHITRVTIKDRYSRPKSRSEAGSLLLDITFSIPFPFNGHLSIPAATWGPLSNLIPSIIEKRIDEDGNVVEDGGWLVTKLKWNGWVKPATIVKIDHVGVGFPDVRKVGFVPVGGMITGDMYFLEPEELEDD
ncbi:hypothetical protein HDU76_000636 [Blyttiomyces sp. JEL0837]|nr:hypothetical protein HDU76_000636 [Blyttiomyces sp. JEL0837]